MKLFVGACSRKVVGVVHGELWSRYRGAAHHAAHSAASHRTDTCDERRILKVTDPDRREPLIVGAEGREEVAAHDREMTCGDVVSLKIGQPDKVSCVISATAWKERLQ